MKSLSNSHGFRLCLDCSTIFQTDKKSRKDMVLKIQSILYMRSELQLKQLNNSSFVLISTVLKEYKTELEPTTT